MSKIFVRDIRDRAAVDSVYLVKEKISSLARNGKPYLTLHLMDKTGEIEGRVWEHVDVIGSRFEKDDFIRVQGKATVYLGKMQLIIADLSRVPDSEVLLADFLPEGDRDPELMLRELHGLLASCSDPHISRLLHAFFDDSRFMQLYRTAPAAKGMHHVHLGGLFEHSLAVAALVDAIMPLYPELNRDLLIAGALLHDVGKVREMTYLRSFDYSDEGKLIGHITIGVEMLHEKILAVGDFPEETAMLLKHMILSHHGQYEFGSPKRPKTVEATVLNYLDDMDSKINGIRTHMRRDAANQSRWTAYHRLYDRYFFKNQQQIEPGEPVAEALPAGPVEQPKPSRKPESDGKELRHNPFQSLKEANLDLF